jgi:hypothetical protein
MMTTKISFVCVFLVALVLSSLLFQGLRAATKRQAASARMTPANDGVAMRVPVIVELFTSEGCSSCPPADTLLAKLETLQPVANAEILALEEHVDYWNGPGWTDPFSSEEWTQRQRDYAAALRTGSVYTPQMIVNGRAEFVGSRGQESLRAVTEAARQGKLDASITAENGGKKAMQQFAVRFGKLAATSPGNKAEVWFAITETGLHSSVTGGENAGQALQHASVVRLLKKIGAADPDKDPSFTGEYKVSFDGRWKLPNLRAVAFVQEKTGLRILGAASTRFEQ